jgi:hypothetical protein
VRRAAGTAAAAGVLVLLAAIAACGSAAPTSHALYSVPRGAWGVSQTNARIGQLWSAGSIPLCTRGGSPVTLTSITPVTVRGEIELVRIAVRHVRWAGPSIDHPPATREEQAGLSDGDYRGIPPDSRSPAGYVIPSPSPCAWPRDGDRFYETIVAGRRTGPRGGWIEGLRVRYRVGSAAGEYVIPFRWALCGGNGPDCS